VAETERARVAWAPRLALALGLFLAAVVVGLLVGALGEPAPPGQESEVQELGGGTGWFALVVAFVVVPLGWQYTAVPLFRRLGPLAPYRVEIHNWISIAVVAVALFHGVELMALGDLRGWLSGWLATILMLGLFVHGWWRGFFRSLWGRRMWRVLHWELAVGALALSVEHWWLIEAAKGG
jgi:hypothetical protein